MYHQTLSYINGIEEPQRQRSYLGTLNYSLHDKYQFQGVMNYSANSSFAKDYRNMPNWAVGGAWVLTDESFMPEIGFLNFLKIRAQGGVVGNETYFPNLYDVDRWSNTNSTSTTGAIYNFGPYSSAQWFGGLRNPDHVAPISQERVTLFLHGRREKEINAGIDAGAFDETLTLALTITTGSWMVLSHRQQAICRMWQVTMAPDRTRISVRPGTMLSELISLSHIK